MGNLVGKGFDKAAIMSSNKSNVQVTVAANYQIQSMFIVMFVLSM